MGKKKVEKLIIQRSFASKSELSVDVPGKKGKVAASIKTLYGSAQDDYTPYARRDAYANIPLIIGAGVVSVFSHKGTATTLITKTRPAPSPISIPPNPHEDN